MASKKNSRSTPPTNLASLIRGLYGRVARQLKVDPSYVSRVARGERQSGAIEASLERELKRIMTLVSKNRGPGGRAAKQTRAGARKKTKV
jgi:hypothetical protein